MATIYSTKSLIRLTENNDRDQTESDHGIDLSSQSTSFLESQEKSKDCYCEYRQRQKRWQ